MNGAGVVLQPLSCCRMWAVLMRVPVVDSGAKKEGVGWGGRELYDKWVRFYFFYWVVMCAR